MHLRKEAQAQIQSASNWMLATLVVTAIGGLIVLTRIPNEPVENLLLVLFSALLAYSLGKAAYGLTRPPSPATLRSGLLGLRSFFRTAIVGALAFGLQGTCSDSTLTVTDRSTNPDPDRESPDERQAPALRKPAPVVEPPPRRFAAPSYPENRALVVPKLPDAKVLLDGVFQCDAPCEIQVPVGDGLVHEVRTTRPGYTDAVILWQPSSVADPLPALPSMDPTGAP